MNGQDITNMPIRKRITSGMSHIPEDRHIIDKILGHISRIFVHPVPRNDLFFVGDSVHVIDACFCHVRIIGNTVDD